MRTDELLSKILKREKGKSQIKMGDAREYHKLMISELAKGCKVNEYNELSFLPNTAMDMVLKQVIRKTKSDR